MRKETKKARKLRQQAYRRSRQGFLIHLYHRIVNRTKGITTRSPELYLGLPVLSRDSFYSWIHNTEDGFKFYELFISWANSGYKKTLTPSVDRIDSSKGYVGGNIQWVTASQNYSFASQSRY